MRQGTRDGILLGLIALFALGLCVLIQRGLQHAAEQLEPAPAPTVMVTVTASPEPAPTVTVTKEPEPAPTVTVTRKAEASRSMPRTSAWIEQVRRCIVHRESRGIVDVRRSDGGTASGLYGFIDRTWNRYKGYRSAWMAPASVQTERFLQVFDGGKGRMHWYLKGAARQCW